MIEKNRTNLERAIRVYERTVKTPEQEFQLTEEQKDVIVDSLTDVSLLLQIPVPPMIFEYNTGTIPAFQRGEVVAGTSAIGFDVHRLKEIMELHDEDGVVDGLRDMVAHELYHFGVELADPSKDLATGEANQIGGEAYRNDPGEREAGRFGQLYSDIKRNVDYVKAMKAFEDWFDKQPR